MQALQREERRIGREAMLDRNAQRMRQHLAKLVSSAQLAEPWGAATSTVQNSSAKGAAQ